MLFRWKPRMQTEHFRKEHWRKSQQWFAISRPHAELVVADQHVKELFKRYCWSFGKHICVSDEHYVPTLLASYGLDGQVWSAGRLANCCPVIETPEKCNQHVRSSTRFQMRVTISYSWLFLCPHLFWEQLPHLWTVLFLICALSCLLSSVMLPCGGSTFGDCGLLPKKIMALEQNEKRCMLLSIDELKWRVVCRKPICTYQTPLWRLSRASALRCRLTASGRRPTRTGLCLGGTQRCIWRMKFHLSWFKGELLSF